MDRFGKIVSLSDTGGMRLMTGSAHSSAPHVLNLASSSPSPVCRRCVPSRFRKKTTATLPDVRPACVGPHRSEWHRDKRESRKHREWFAAGSFAARSSVCLDYRLKIGTHARNNSSADRQKLYPVAAVGISARGECGRVDRHMRRAENRAFGEFDAAPHAVAPLFLADPARLLHSLCSRLRTLCQVCSSVHRPISDCSYSSIVGRVCNALQDPQQVFLVRCAFGAERPGWRSTALGMEPAYAPLPTGS